MWPFRQHFHHSSTVAQNLNINRMRFSHFMKQTSMVINGAGATNPLKRSLTVQSCLFLGRCFQHKHYLSFQLHTDLYFSIPSLAGLLYVEHDFCLLLSLTKCEGQWNLESLFNLLCFQHLCRNLISAHIYCKSVGLHLQQEHS